MGKRANGEGSITHRGDGRYMYRWMDHQGRRQTGYARTHEAARRLLREALARVEEGLPSVETAETFQAVAERWRRTAAVRQRLAASSMNTYTSTLKVHVYPVIGSKRMRDLKPEHVTEVLAKMKDAGLANSTLHVAHKAMSNVCKMAMDDGLMTRNPTTKVKAPRPDPAPRVVPSREQVSKMIESAPDPRARILITVLAHTGLRIGEALSLRWADWDGHDRLTVVGKGGRIRGVPVTETLARELRAWRKVQAEERLASAWWDERPDLILSTSVGTSWDASNARRIAFRPAAEAACPGATPHSLRHAAATVMLEDGVPMRVVQELLGHKDMRTTAEIYSHVTDRLVAEAGGVLERALGGGSRIDTSEGDAQW